jgi:hypothetical protein
MSNALDAVADIFKTGASAWVDSQRIDAARVNDPTYNTQDGRAGTAQFTSVAQVLSSPLVMGGAVLLGVLLVVLIVKKS